MGRGITHLGGEFSLDVLALPDVQESKGHRVHYNSYVSLKSGGKIDLNSIEVSTSI